MKTNQKFNPRKLNDLSIESEENYIEDPSFENQALSYSKQKEKLEVTGIENDINRKTEWSNLLKNYLIIFTIAMFITLWGNKSTFYSFCYSKHCVNLGRFDLNSVNLNYLITAGFINVLGVVAVIVSHHFPSKETQKKQLSNNYK